MRDEVLFTVYRKKAFTLIELIIFLALLGVVLAIGYRLFFFGQRAFAVGSDQFQLQSEIRKAGDFIIDEVRNATEIDIINTPFFAQTGYGYIYLHDSKIVYEYSGGTRDITDSLLKDEDVFSIRKDSDNRNFLCIDMTGTLNGNSYNLSTEILLKNVVNKSPQSGKVIKYKKLMP